MNTDSLFDLKNKVILITGSSGQLGYEYSKALLSRGACVIGLDRSKNAKAEELEKEFSKKFHFFEADITKKDSLEKVVEQLKKLELVPSVLINNAAIDSPPGAPASENGPFESYPEASWDRVLDVNLKGTFLACQVFGKEMSLKKNGSIINVSSIYGVVSPDQNLYDYRRKRGEVFFKPVAYSASKSGIINLSKYLAVYWAKENVRVNTLVISGVFNNQEAAFLEVYNSRIPVGRMATSQDYIGGLVYLASDASKYMTGTELVIDGGWTAI